MLGTVEDIFSGEAFGAPEGGQTNTTITRIVYWPGGQGVLELSGLSTAGGATMKLTGVNAPLFGLPRLNDDLDVDDELSDGCWFFALPECQIVFVINMPVDGGHITIADFKISRIAT